MVNPFSVKKIKELDDNSPKKTDSKDPKTIAKLVVDGRYSIPYMPERLEECHSDMVSEVQGECVFSETVLPGLCDFTYSVPNPVKPSDVDESFIRCYGRLGNLGDCEW